MYGTLARIRPKSGHMDQIQKMSETWERERAPNVDGFIASYVYRLDRDPDELRLVVVFEDRERYFANAEDPEQNRWYQQLREHLEDDPDWEDGEIVHSAMKAQV